MRLTDQQWERLSRLMPARARTGRPRRHDRTMVEAMLWTLRTGAPWRDLPSMYGPWQTAYKRFSGWCGDGVLAAILERLTLDADACFR